MRNIPLAKNRLYITFNLNEVIFASSQDQNIFSFYKNHFPKGINIKIFLLESSFIVVKLNRPFSR